MTARGRNLFYRYVDSSLNHPDLRALSLESHAFNLRCAARDEHIVLTELTEEFGPLSQALALAVRK